MSWPDNGWYEVQSATSFNTITEGGRSATLPHGTYNLINHTTGERFENVSIGDSQQGKSAIRNADLLSNSKEPAVGIGNDYALLAGGSFSDDGSRVVSSRTNAEAVDMDAVDTLVTTETITYPDSTPEDFRSDQRVVTGGGALISLGGAAFTGPVGWGGLAAAGLGALGAGYLHEMVGSETVTTTNTMASDGSITRTQTGDTRLEGNDPIRASTTTVTSFISGRQVTTHTDGLTGNQRTIDTDDYGVTEVTVSRADTSSTNSPRTNVTTNEDGVAETTYTSPTGGTYTPTAYSTNINQVADEISDETDDVETAPEPVSQPAARNTDSRRGNYSENDSDSHSGGRSDSSDFGSRTSQPGGMGGV